MNEGLKKTSFIEKLFVCFKSCDIISQEPLKDAATFFIANIEQVVVHYGCCINSMTSKWFTSSILPYEVLLADRDRKHRHWNTIKAQSVPIKVLDLYARSTLTIQLLQTNQVSAPSSVNRLTLWHVIHRRQRAAARRTWSTWATLWLQITFS